MDRYKVYYMKDFGTTTTQMYMLNAGEISITEICDPDDIEATHTFVKEVEAEYPETVFMMMQAERWNPNGEARDLIKSLGLKHTSMSIGDVVLDLDSGEVFLCDMCGFTLIEKEEPITFQNIQGLMECYG